MGISRVVEFVCPIKTEVQLSPNPYFQLPWSNMKLFKLVLNRLGLVKKTKKQVSIKDTAFFVVNKRAEVLKRLAEYDRQGAR